ncbi:MAG: D-alanyl-D-alanine carboxypeptidase family protein [Solirubrobacteraceae bacterium]
MLVASSAATLPTAAAAARPAPPALSVTGAALYAPATGQLLYGVDPDRRLAIASTTKLMTALVTVQHIHHLGVTFTQNDWYPAADDSQIGLVPGERMSVHDLLLALMLPSADDAAEDLAYNIGHGSVARFVGMMNAQARALHLRNTHYSTPIGLDTQGNWSTADDLVHLAAYDLSHSRYLARIVSLPGAVLHSGREVRTIVNRNDLVSEYPWIDGVKTGHTDDAGYVLVASGQRDGMTLISAVLGTDSEQSRDANTLALLDYGFGAFRVWTPVRRGDVLARVPVRGAAGERVGVVAARGWRRILPRSDHLRVVAHVPRQLSGPLAAGARVGRAAVLHGRRVLAWIPLTLQQRLAAPVPKLAARLIGRPPVISMLGGLLAMLAGLGIRRAGRRTVRESDGSGRELEVG